MTITVIAAEIAERGNCRFSKGIGPGVMYAEDGPGAELAKKVCFGLDSRTSGECPIRLKCLEHAVRENEIYGVWGGNGQRERARARRILLDTGRLVDIAGMERAARAAAKAARLALRGPVR